MHPGGGFEAGQEVDEIGLGGAQLLGAAQDHGAGLQELRIVRVRRQRLVDKRAGLRDPVRLVFRADHVHPGFDQGLVQGDRRAQPAHGRLGPALLEKRAAELAGVFGVARLGADQFGEDRFGAGAVVHVQEDIAAVRLHGGVLGVELGRLVEDGDRLRVAEQPAVDHAQYVQQFHVARIALDGGLAPD